MSSEKRRLQYRLFEPVVEAQHLLVSLAGCLILNESAHPDSGYPQSLDPAPADWPCARKFDPSAIKEYSLTFSPLTDRSTGHISDFQLIVTPLGDPVRWRYPLMVDNRGIVFNDAKWGTSKPYIRAATSEARASEIWKLQRNIQQYIDEKLLKAAPTQLNAEMVGEDYGFGVASIKDDGTSLVTKHYMFHYQALQWGRLAQFALSAQCQSYGQDCLRSYFLDDGGGLHATGEPRAASAKDPLALDCEDSDSVCADVEWPVL